MKDDSVLFNLRRENEGLKKEVINLQNQLLVRQDLIDRMMNTLLERTHQLMQATVVILKLSGITKEEGGDDGGETKQ